MKKTIDIHQFRQAFADYNRKDNFSYDGLGALYDWLEDYSEETGHDVELDVISLCCDFTEYSDLAEAAEYYAIPLESGLDDDEREAAILGWLNDHTFVIEFDGGVILQNF